MRRNDDAEMAKGECEPCHFLEGGIFSGCSHILFVFVCMTTSIRRHIRRFPATMKQRRKVQNTCECGALCCVCAIKFRVIQIAMVELAFSFVRKRERKSMFPFAQLGIKCAIFRLHVL